MLKKMKKTVYISWWGSNLATKLGVLVILWVLGFMLLQHRSSDFLPLFQNTQNSSASPLTNNVENAERCDLLVGGWVPYEGEPLYNKNCTFIIDSQNCINNGRPDSDFLHWRWKPRACDLPPFNPLVFLETMRNKSWAFVGDSLARNHFQSLMCMLSAVEEASLVYHNEDGKTLKWLFPSYNLTATVIWSPFLAKATIPKNINGASPAGVHVHLDVLDPSWTDHLKTWDFTVFSSGVWYSANSIYYENNTILGCHNCAKNNLTELGAESPYRKMMKSMLDHIVRSNHTGSAFYRTTAPNHYEGGEWFNGGVCEKTGPAKEGEFELSWLDKTLGDVEMEELGKGYENGVKIRVLDVRGMSLLRPDGHPGRYRWNVKENNNSVKNTTDCLHWCLPGPIDSWNDVLMEMIINP